MGVEYEKTAEEREAEAPVKKGERLDVRIEKVQQGYFENRPSNLEIIVHSIKTFPKVFREKKWLENSYLELKFRVSNRIPRPGEEWDKFMKGELRQLMLATKTQSQCQALVDWDKMDRETGKKSTTLVIDEPKFIDELKSQWEGKLINIKIDFNEKGYMEVEDIKTPVLGHEDATATAPKSSAPAFD